MQQFDSPTRILCIVALIVLTTLALTGTVDQWAKDDLDGAIQTTGTIYATARGINALVSVLQGTELDLPFVTLTIGEVLDPINDLIERFSTVVLFALGAVATQKILLAMVSSGLFNYAFTAIAILTGVGLLARKPLVLAPLLKCFLCAVFVRFALGIVVIANYWVDIALLRAGDAERHSAMQAFEGELRAVKNLTTQESDYSDARAHLQEEIQRLETLLQVAREMLEAREQEIAKAKSQLDEQLEGEDRVCRLSVGTPFLSPTCDAAVKPRFDTLRTQREDRAELLSRINAVSEELGNAHLNLDCLNKRSAGIACTFWDRIPDPPDISAIQRNIDGLNAKLSDFTENAWLLLISVLLKSVAIPLLFFYALLKGTGLLWKSDFDKHLC